ncbi:MAG: hypothetical protein GWN58_03225, partial [Anaerolineae bacterium]|nr:hypothetical protein [Anaerolineae bacterium]
MSSTPGTSTPTSSVLTTARPRQPRCTWTAWTSRRRAATSSSATSSSPSLHWGPLAGPSWPPSG